MTSQICCSFNTLVDLHHQYLRHCLINASVATRMYIDDKQSFDAIIPDICKSLLVIVEGEDRVGKSTTVARLVEYCKTLGLRTNEAGFHDIYPDDSYYQVFKRYKDVLEDIHTYDITICDRFWLSEVLYSYITNRRCDLHDVHISMLIQRCFDIPNSTTLYLRRKDHEQQLADNESDELKVLTAEQLTLARNLYDNYINEYSCTRREYVIRL